MTPALLDTSKVIVGASGSGKTVTAKHDVQQLLEQRRHVAIVDPTGVWWGMRSNAAGDGAGFDLPIFGGEHGDVPIRPSDGAAIARIVVDQRVSAIVDISGMDNSRDWRVFMAEFVAGLRRKPKGNFHLVLDEADEFAAERVADDIGFRLREDLVWMAKRGRAQGFVPTYITQRTAEIAKAVISQAQTIVAHQLIAPTDQKAIDDYLKGHAAQDVRKQVMASLAELEVGERWIYSPRLKILERGVTPGLTTFDSSRTPAPGEQLHEPRTLAQLDVSAIRAALAPRPVEALPGDIIPADPGEAYAKGGADGTMIVERNRRIAELEFQVSDLTAANKLLAATARELAGNRDWLSERLAKIRALALVSVDRRDEQPRSGTAPDLHPSDANLHDEKTGSAPAPGNGSQPAAEGASSGESAAPPPPPPGDAPDREYKALAGLAAAYPAGFTEAAWAARTGYSRKGGAWLRRRKRYIDDELIEQRDGRWFATPAGVDRAGADIPDMPPPGVQLVKWWSDRLTTSAARRALQLLAQVHPKALNRDAIAIELGMAPKGGAFLRAIAEIKAAELVTETGKRIRVAEILMGEKS